MDAVLTVLGLLTSQLIVEGVDGFLEELHLHLVLLLDVAVLDHDLLIVLLDVGLKLSEHAHLQLLVVVNVLGNPIDGVLEGSDIALILADA